MRLLVSNPVGNIHDGAVGDDEDDDDDDDDNAAMGAADRPPSCCNRAVAVTELIWARNEEKVERH